jgi:FKBP-type peptidyl-prolyl cis-trans isomerase
MGERIRVHYTGWLTNGKVFDSSRKRGEPIEFRLGEVISGWNEGLQLMSPGDVFKLTIPPELGYGERPQGEIPSNSTPIAVALRSPDPGKTPPRRRG